MKLTKIVMISALIVVTSMTAACSTKGAVEGTVNTAGFVTKTAVNGTIGAGKLAYNGVRTVTGNAE